MFGLGWWEVAIIVAVAIVVFGPKKLPELGGSLGKGLRGFKEEFAQREEEDEDKGEDGGDR